MQQHDSLESLSLTDLTTVTGGVRPDDGGDGTSLGGGIGGAAGAAAVAIAHGLGEANPPSRPGRGHARAE